MNDKETGYTQSIHLLTIAFFIEESNFEMLQHVITTLNASLNAPLKHDPKTATRVSTKEDTLLDYAFKYASSTTVCDIIACLRKNRADAFNAKFKSFVERIDNHQSKGIDGDSEIVLPLLRWRKVQDQSINQEQDYLKSFAKYIRSITHSKI
jgi:hypothetical protein